MSPWVRKLFINIMPRLLFMQRPHYAPRYTAGLPEAIDGTGKMTLTSTGTASTCNTAHRHKPNGHVGATLEAKWDEDFEDDDCTSHCRHHPHLRSPSPHSHRSHHSSHHHHSHHHQRHHHHHHHCCPSSASTNAIAPLGAPHGPLPPEPALSPCCSEDTRDCCADCGDCCVRGDGTLQRSERSHLLDGGGEAKGGSPADTQVAAALKGVEFIAQHIKKADKDNEVSRGMNQSRRQSVALTRLSGN